MTENETKMKFEKIKYFVIGFLGSILIRFLFSTITVEERPCNYAKNFKRQGKNVIYAFWHSFMLVPAYTGRNLGIKVLISHHTDGEYIAQVIQRLGHNVVRGSTTRGGTKALLSMIKKAKEGETSLAITPDGPRGPRFMVQPGIIFLGQKTGYPILPASLGLTKYWELPSWDKFRIPKPFSKVVLTYGDPIMIPPKLDKSKVEEYRELLEKTLNEMTVEAEHTVKVY
ncbi:MAG: lysophospholipid acyltransferase family protein [Candidatus Scalinduaceae bacterium]